MGCLAASIIQYVATPLRDNSMIFDGLLTPAARAALVMSISVRNEQAHLLPSMPASDLSFMEPEQINAFRDRADRVPRAYAAFSRPGYSSQGQALVYVTNWCGGLCGHGWFFLLDRQGGKWRVQARHMIWIS
jgi:hypothetical protein